MRNHCTHYYIKIAKSINRLSKYTVITWIISHRCILILWEKNTIPFARIARAPLSPPPHFSSGSQNGSAPSPLVARKPSKFFTLSAVSFGAEKSGDISLEGARPNLRSTNCDELCTFEKERPQFEFPKTCQS